MEVYIVSHIPSHHVLGVLDISQQSYLVGGFNHLEKYESQWEGWHPIYEMENKIHVPNHQPDIYHNVLVNILYLRLFVSPMTIKHLKRWHHWSHGFGEWWSSNGRLLLYPSIYVVPFLVEFNLFLRKILILLILLVKNVKNPHVSWLNHFIPHFFQAPDAFFEQKLTIILQTKMHLPRRRPRHGLRQSCLVCRW